MVERVVDAARRRRAGRPAACRGTSRSGSRARSAPGGRSTSNSSRPSAGPASSACRLASSHARSLPTIDQHDGVARLLRGALRASQHAAEERVGDVGDDERDAARDAGPQRPRRDVRAVAELLRGGAHGLLGACGDAAGGLAGEHERDRRLRDAGAARDVDAGDAGRSADSVILGPRGRTRRRGGGHRRARAVPVAPAQRRSAAVRGGVRRGRVHALLGRAVAERAGAGARRRRAGAARRARARAGLRARPAVAGGRGGRRPRARDRLGGRLDRDHASQRRAQRAGGRGAVLLVDGAGAAARPRSRGTSCSRPTCCTRSATAPRCCRCSRA